MRRLVIATPMLPPEAGGPGTFAALVARELPELGVAVEVVNYRDAAGGWGFRHRDLSRRVRAAAAPREGEAGPAPILALDPGPVGLPAYLAARALGAPFFLRVAGDYAWERSRLGGERRGLDEFSSGRAPLAPLPFLLWHLERFLARRASVVIVPSGYLARLVGRWGVAAEKVAVIGNAYDPSGAPIVARADARARWGIRGKLIVSAGRLVPWKHFPELVASFAAALARVPDAELAIAGDGPERAAIEAAVATSGAGDRVRLVGNLAKADLYSLLAAADCLALNSSYEGLSHQILEAMALEVPVVATDAGGNPDIVKEGETGWLVPTGDGAQLAAALAECLADDGEAKRRAVRAAALVASMTPRRVAEEVLSALKI
jgi:glycosyltransferase involved in cell wall biosynthesis